MDLILIGRTCYTKIHVLVNTRSKLWWLPRNNTFLKHSLIYPKRSWNTKENEWNIYVLPHKHLWNILIHTFFIHTFNFLEWLLITTLIKCVEKNPPRLILSTFLWEDLYYIILQDWSRILCRYLYDMKSNCKWSCGEGGTVGQHIDPISSRGATLLKLQ